MRPAIFDARLVGRARLVEIPTPETEAQFKLVAGGSTFLVASARRPRRFLTYDTGSVRTLFVDLGPGFDAKAPPVEITGWHAIGFFIAGMRTTYWAHEARGSVTFRRRERLAWLGLGPRIDVKISLRFDTPVHDRARLGPVEIDWRVSAPGSIVSAPSIDGR